MGSLRHVPHPAAAARFYTIRCFDYFLVPTADFSIWEVKGYTSPTSVDGLAGFVTRSFVVFFPFASVSPGQGE